MTSFRTQAKLGLPKDTIRATVLIDTILAAIEMDETLSELRDHSAGLNCGPLGLHLQLYQEICRRPKLRYAGSGAGRNDHPFPAQL